MKISLTEPVTRFIIRRRDGFYYRRGPVPHWSDDLGSATVFEFRTVAELEAMKELSGYTYDVVPIEL